MLKCILIRERFLANHNLYHRDEEPLGPLGISFTVCHVLFIFL